jgi:transcriptional regulator with XRE-family HTH domain
MAAKGSGNSRTTSQKIKKEMGERLYRHREALGLTSDEFAEMIGENGGTYRRWERGEVQPSMHALHAMRRETGVDLNWLVCGDPPRRR